jgi:hypothetical protein
MAASQRTIAITFLDEEVAADDGTPSNASSDTAAPARVPGSAADVADDDADPSDPLVDALVDYVASQAATLTRLSLRGTRLTPRFVTRLAQLLHSKRLSKLTCLDIGLCGIEVLDDAQHLCKVMASAIAHCPSLQALDLSGMSLFPPFVGIAFAAAVRANKSIREVNVVGCDRGGTGFERLIARMVDERNEQIAASEGSDFKLALTVSRSAYLIDNVEL